MTEKTKQEFLEKLPPQSIEAEESVLGGIMLEQESIFKIADILLPEDFYKPEHKEIYDAALELFEKNHPIDFLTLSSRLKEKGVLDQIGGHTYLSTLVNKVPTASNILHYAKIVRSKRILRELISAGREISELGFEESADIDATLDEAEQKIFAITQRTTRENFRHIKDELSLAFERMDQLQKGEGATLRGIPSGFKNLDYLLAGLQPSDFIILAARPSLGKTALALDIARRVAVSSKIPVGIFSLEMARGQVVDRLISAESGVPLWKIRTGRLSDQGEYNDFQAIQEAFSRLAESPIFIDDTPSPTVLQIRTLARRLQAEGGLGLLVIDYIQLIHHRENYDSMVQRVTEISRGLKALARELNVPLLAISQLSRAVEHRPNQMPILSDLRESGSLEQDADVVLMLYREDRADPRSERKNIVDVCVRKHRNGPLGQVPLYFDQELVNFKDIETKIDAYELL